MTTLLIFLLDARLLCHVLYTTSDVIKCFMLVSRHLFDFKHARCLVAECNECRVSLFLVCLRLSIFIIFEHAY